MKRSILGLLLAAFAYLSMTGFSSGGGTNSMQGNRTGAGGTQKGCDGSGCHNGSTGNVAIDFYLVNMLTGDTVKNGEYLPGNNYILRLYAFTTGVFPKFGFQLAAQKSVGMTGTGNYIPTSGLQANPIGQYEVIEQLQPLNATVNNRFIQDIKWKAPSSGAGQLKFFITVLASDGNGFTNGDIWGNTEKTYNQNTTSIEEFMDNTVFNVYPNPVDNVLRLTVKGAEGGTYGLKLYSVTGQLVQEKNSVVNATNAEISMDVSTLSRGTYFLKVDKDGRQKLMPIIKN